MGGAKVSVEDSSGASVLSASGREGGMAVRVKGEGEGKGEEEGEEEGRGKGRRGRRGRRRRWERRRRGRRRKGRRMNSYLVLDVHVPKLYRPKCLPSYLVPIITAAPNKRWHSQR